MTMDRAAVERELINYGTDTEFNVTFYKNDGTLRAFTGCRLTADYIPYDLAAIQGRSHLGVAAVDLSDGNIRSFKVDRVVSITATSEDN